ncbi:DUF5819 family protein [Actinocrinis sp.]|uniref:DUF5819 family protein n=1 Tax=Actinocrinis sp. TaxID=1920516 RepID=UPI002D56B033|nr:DUF5819 family protein [Actinocrinis sp.]HZP51586.1 DUF5819 family protein [Actinocrinis sp.]
MSASTPGSGTAIGREPAQNPTPLTRSWSRALVGGTTLAVVLVVALHLAATFLYNAPANPVSQRYARSVNRWMQPLFTQNWQLFAPNPISENVEIDARASLDPDGRLTGWVNLSAQDEAAVLGNPVPGHITENQLRNAWFQWLDTHDANGNPTGANADVMQKYLMAVALERLGGHVGSGTIGSVQIRAITTLIPGPGRTPAQIAPQTRTLDWWSVTQNPDARSGAGGDGASGSDGSNRSNGSNGSNDSNVTQVGTG